MKKLNINNKQASEVIPVINDLIDRIEQLEILVNTQNSKKTLVTQWHNTVKLCHPFFNPPSNKK